jgi:dihydrofolate synthase/folylpolyglutamate synthase
MNPEEGLQCIHVAGTNGKGSVCTKMAKAYELSGHTTGLFTSPHISSFRERFQITGESISQEEVVEGITRIRSCCSDDLTFFEITTLLAFLWFQKRHVQMAVLETGLGGRLDATNVCHPQMCVITSISFDHMNYLGNTLESIAMEKAGIVKEGIPVVIGPRVSSDVVCREAKKKSAPVFQVQGVWNDFDAENSAIARQALLLLHMPSKIIEEALRVRPPCRFQEIDTEQLSTKWKEIPEAVILDVAHNPDGIQHLLMKAKASYPNSRVCMLLAVSQDKDVKEMIESLCGCVGAVVCTEAPTSRAMPASMLAQMVQQASEDVHVMSASTPEKALCLALEFAATNHHILLVTGTFFCMSAIRQALGFPEVVDGYDLNCTHRLISNSRDV